MNIPNSQTKWILVGRPSGKLQPDIFKLVTEELTDSLSDNQILIKVIYISIDPTQRNAIREDPPYSPRIELGSVVPSFAIGQVLKTTSKKFEVGDWVSGSIGMQQYAKVSDSEGVSKIEVSSKYPLHAALNNYGLTGLTAYVGLFVKGNPKEGETLLVSGASGATGLAAGVYGKIHGLRVVGIAGTDEKCKNLTGKYGFDGSINYKTQDIDAEIKRLCPKGVDVFYDNVGGKLLNTVLPNINKYARIVICGAISQYNNKSQEEAEGIPNYVYLLYKTARMEGFLLYDHKEILDKATKDIIGWMDQGKMPVLPVDISKGINSCIEAFMGLFEGKNHGKTLVEVCPPPAPFDKQ